MNTRARFTAVSIAGAFLLLSGSASAQRRGPGLFAGTFSVTSNTTVTVTSPISTTESRVTRERAEVRMGSRADMAFHVTNDRGERCVLEGNLASESSVTFLSGQRCAMTDPVRNLRMNLTLRNGSGAISGSHLSLHLSWGVATNAGFIDVTGTASQETSGNRTSGGPVAVAPPPAQGASPIVVPAPQIAQPVMLGIDPPSTGSRSRRTRRGSTDGVVMTGAVPVVPSIPPAPIPVAADTPIWGLPTDTTPIPSTAAPAPMAPMAPVAPAPAPPTPVRTAPAANTPTPLWGAATPGSSPGFGAAQPATSFGTIGPAQGLGAPPLVPAANGPAPMFGAQPSMPSSSLGTPSAWGSPGTPQVGAPRPTAPTGGPLVTFGQMPGGAPAPATGGAAPTFGTPQPAAPWGYPQPGPYGYPQQPTGYGYPQPGAAPYGYPQPAPAQGSTPLVQFGGQRAAPASAWAPAPGAPAPMQPAPAPGGPRPLVMFSVTNGAL